MKFRPLMIRAAAVALLLTTVAASSFADDHKRRSASPNPGSAAAAPNYVWLEGIVVDADMNTPVAGAEIREGSRGGIADGQGKFYLRLIAGTEVTVVLSRSGYQSRSQTVKITADTLQTFLLTSLATTTIRTSSGATYNVDTETLEFGYIAPFTEYRKFTYLNLCTSDADSFRPDRADIKRVTSAVQLSNAKCCPGRSMPAINVELKSGGTFTAAFADACVGYSVDAIAIDHVTARPVYIRFSDITEVLIP
jgi:hypothetical protein